MNHSEQIHTYKLTKSMLFERYTYMRSSSKRNFPIFRHRKHCKTLFHTTLFQSARWSWWSFIPFGVFASHINIYCIEYLNVFLLFSLFCFSFCTHQFHRKVLSGKNVSLFLLHLLSFRFFLPCHTQQKQYLYGLLSFCYAAIN